MQQHFNRFKKFNVVWRLLKINVKLLNIQAQWVAKKIMGACLKAT